MTYNVSNPLIQEFKKNAELRLKDNLRFITICLEKLSESDVWQAENETCNSVGNQILHVCGNMQQYAINAILNQKDSRDRDSEFSSKNTLNKAQLQLKMSETINDAIAAINNLSETEWLKEHNVQSFKMTSLACVFHAVEHCSYHTGQIAFITKLKTGNPLGFWDGIKLD